MSYGACVCLISRISFYRTGCNSLAVFSSISLFIGSLYSNVIGSGLGVDDDDDDEFS